MKALDVLKNKIFTEEQLRWELNRWQLKDEKVVFTNGCFDLLHQGHIDYLSKAADLGTKLIVGVNSDASIKRLNKGKSRPIQDETSRAIIIAALHFVSAVVIFDETNPLNLITFIRPTVLVKGSDYKIEEIVGHEVVQSYGGLVKTIDFLQGYSTSAIEAKIKYSAVYFYWRRTLQPFTKNLPNNIIKQKSMKKQWPVMKKQWLRALIISQLSKV